MSVWALADGYRWLCINFRYKVDTLSFGSELAGLCLIEGREGWEDPHCFLLISLLKIVQLGDFQRLFKTGNL